MLHFGFENVLFHRMRLTCAGKHIAPEPALRLYLSPSRNGQGNGYVRELTLPVSDDHIGLPRHCRMYRVVPQHQAEGGVVWTRRHDPNRVTRVNIFQVEFRAGLLEVLNNVVLQIQSHVTEPNVSRCVPLSCGLDEILSCSFSYDNHCMAAIFQSILQRSEECCHRESDLWNQAEVDVVRRNRCV